MGRLFNVSRLYVGRGWLILKKRYRFPFRTGLRTGVQSSGILVGIQEIPVGIQDWFLPEQVHRFLLEPWVPSYGNLGWLFANSSGPIPFL